jgi:hypothetical protein
MHARKESSGPGAINGWLAVGLPQLLSYEVAPRRHP